MTKEDNIIDAVNRFVHVSKQKYNGYAHSTGYLSQTVVEFGPRLSDDDFNQLLKYFNEYNNTTNELFSPRKEEEQLHSLITYLNIELSALKTAYVRQGVLVGTLVKEVAEKDSIIRRYESDGDDYS